MRCTPFERRMINGVLIAVAISVTFSVQSTRLSAAGPTTCENLATLALPDATITIAQLVPAGSFIPPALPTRRKAAPLGKSGGTVNSTVRVTGSTVPYGTRAISTRTR